VDESSSSADPSTGNAALVAFLCSVLPLSALGACCAIPASGIAADITPIGCQLLSSRMTGSEIQFEVIIQNVGQSSMTRPFEVEIEITAHYPQSLQYGTEQFATTSGTGRLAVDRPINIMPYGGIYVTNRICVAPELTYDANAVYELCVFLNRNKGPEEDDLYTNNNYYYARLRGADL